MPDKLFILSADDDADDQDLIEDALKQTMFPHFFTRVPDGERLLALLNEQSTEGKFPDLIFLDLNMPIKSGREAIRQLKSESSVYRGIPVVILTTSSSQEDIHYCMSNGANGYLVKPNTFSELIAIIEKTIAAHCTTMGKGNNTEIN
jgi:CheY-like chemotaxis protein